MTTGSLFATFAALGQTAEWDVDEPTAKAVLTKWENAGYDDGPRIKRQPTRRIVFTETNGHRIGFDPADVPLIYYVPAEIVEQ